MENKCNLKEDIDLKDSEDILIVKEIESYKKISIMESQNTGAELPENRTSMLSVHFRDKSSKISLMSDYGTLNDTSELLNLTIGEDSTYVENISQVKVDEVKKKLVETENCKLKEENERWKRNYDLLKIQHGYIIATANDSTSDATRMLDELMEGRTKRLKLEAELKAYKGENDSIKEQLNLEKNYTRKNYVVKYEELAKKNKILLKENFRLQNKEGELNKEISKVLKDKIEVANLSHDLNTKVVKLNSKLKENESNIKILQDRNFDAEVKLSKTRKFINHIKRENNYMTQKLQKDLQNCDNSYRSLRNEYIRSKNRWNYLDKKCFDLQKRLQGNKLNEVQYYENKEYYKQLKSNANMLVKHILEEREIVKKLEDKLKNSNNNCEMSNKAFEESRESIRKYKEALEKLENKLKEKEMNENIKVSGNKVNRSENEYENIIILKKIIEDKNSELNKKNIELNKLKSDLNNCKRQYTKDKKQMRETIKDLEYSEKHLITQVNQESNVNAENSMLKQKLKKCQNVEDNIVRQNVEMKELRETLFKLREENLDKEKKLKEYLKVYDQDMLSKEVKIQNSLPTNNLKSIISPSKIELIQGGTSNNTVIRNRIVENNEALKDLQIGTNEYNNLVGINLILESLVENEEDQTPVNVSTGATAKIRFLSSEINVQEQNIEKERSIQNQESLKHEFYDQSPMQTVTSITNDDYGNNFELSYRSDDWGYFPTGNDDYFEPY